MKEVWAPIPGYEGHYWASNFGQIKSKWAILNPATTPKGYLRVSLCVSKLTKNYQVHRLIALTFIPNPDNKPEVNHKDLNKKHNHVENLEWNTKSENRRHYLNNGGKSGTEKQVLNTDTGEVYGSITEAHKHIGGSYVHIADMLHKKGVYKNLKFIRKQHPSVESKE